MLTRRFDTVEAGMIPDRDAGDPDLATGLVTGPSGPITDIFIRGSGNPDKDEARSTKYEGVVGSTKNVVQSGDEEVTS
jgi:hypothetical protein